MARGRSLWHAAVLGLLFTGLVTFAGSPGSGKELSIKLKQRGRNVILECVEGSGAIEWEKDAYRLSDKGNELPLGSAMDDPRGSYQCIDEKNKRSAPLQVFFRMCQNCVQLNISTILGVMLASLVATLFLATAVYCVAIEEPRRRSQVASDKQNLLANEQLYQPLGERNNGQYSHIGVAKARHR